MKELKELLAKGKRLREAATPEPWAECKYEKRAIEQKDKCTSQYIARIYSGESDVKFVTYARNTQETYEQIIQIAVEALEQILRPEKDIGLGCSHEFYAEQALTKISGLAKQAAAGSFASEDTEIAEKSK